MQAWLTRMYERDGARYFSRAGLFIGGLMVVVVFPLASWAPARYEGLSIAEYGVLMLVGAPFLLFFTAALFYAIRKPFRAMVAWHRRQGDADLSPEARRAAFELPGRIARLVGTAGIFATPVAVGVLTVWSGHTTTWDFLELTIGWQAEVGLLTMAIYVLVDLTMRPVRANIGLTTMVRPSSAGLKTRLVLALISLTLMSCIYVGAFLTDRESAGAGNLFVVYAVALGLTAAWAGLLLPLVSLSVLEPVRDLIRGTRSVAAGNLKQRVLVTTEDELGELAASFNEMVDGLRERQRLAGENELLLAEVRASRARIVAASDAERRRVERNIHDGAQQQLVALAVKLRMLQERAGDDEELRTAIGELGGRLKLALDELRELARGLHPAVLTTDGLSPALEQLGSRAPLDVTVSAPDERFPEAVESTAYFVASEALANVAKYAHASHAEVSVERRNGRLMIQIADDGIGGAHADSGSGLAGLVDRVAALDGRLTIESPEGTGTKVRAELPLT